MTRAPVSIESLDFEQMGDQELHALMSRAKEALAVRFTSRIQEFREAAREAGFTVILTKIGKEERRGAKRHPEEADRRRGVNPKFRNPDNPAETWAGRGRKPKWVADRLAQGASLDDLLINREAIQQNGIEAGNV